MLLNNFIKKLMFILSLYYFLYTLIYLNLFIFSSLNTNPAHAADLPGSPGGAGDFIDPTDPAYTSDMFSAYGGNGNGYGGGGGGGGPNSNNRFGGYASLDGAGGDGAASIMGTVTTPGGKGGVAGAISLDLNPVNLQGTNGGAGVNNTGSGGGGGGAGLFLTGENAYSITGESTITGGTGGLGGYGYYQKASGGGGGGGAGVLLRRVTLTTSSKTTITGGSGGNGGSAPAAFVAGGGAGGDGVVVQSGSFYNKGNITGGSGGNTSNDYADFNTGATGGTGGSGAYISEGIFLNQGQITGGRGGTGFHDATKGTSGSGLRIELDSYIINQGSISAGDTDSNAIDIIGNNNIFEIHNGSSITGNVVVKSGTLGNTLVFGGRAHNSFDVALIGVQYQGFQSYRKNGSGTWVLTGTSDFTEDFTVIDGAISVSSDRNLGNKTASLILDGGTLQVTGTSFTSSDRNISIGKNGGGFDIADPINTFTVSQSLSGNGHILKHGEGTLILSGNNNFTGGLTIEQGTVQAGVEGHAFGAGLLIVKADTKAVLENFNITTGGLSGSGNIILGSGELTLNQNFDTLYSGSIDGSGALTKDGSGVLILAGTNKYSGRTTISGGTLEQGAVNVFNTASSEYIIEANGELHLGGFNTSVANLRNAGNIDFGGTGGTVLNIKGHYISNDGIISINTVLGGDSSKTDLVHINGNATGLTKIYVYNIGGTGALTNNGIKVIDIDGQSKGIFLLANNYQTKDGKHAVVGGAYAYTLQQGTARSPNDKDWYLVSHIDGSTSGKSRYSAGVPVYEGYAQNIQGLNKLPTLQQRTGYRYWNNQINATLDNDASMKNYGIWTRIETAYSHIQSDSSTSRMKQGVNSVILQAGSEGKFYESENGSFLAGITGQYGFAKSSISSPHGDGNIDTQSWSIGATATWYENSGFYADTQGQLIWLDSNLNSKTANTSLVNGQHATGYALSIETGKHIRVQNDWVLTPQAQLTWSSIAADIFKDIWGNRISLHHSDSLIARLGLTSNHEGRWEIRDGYAAHTNIYGTVNLYQEFFKGAEVNVADTYFSAENSRNWAGVGAGGTFAWAEGKYLVYSEGSVNTSLTHFADSYILTGTIGFKIKW